MTQKTLLFLFLFLSGILIAQEKITLEQIWSGYFRTQQMQKLQAMKNANQYTILNQNSIDLYDFETLEKIKTIFATPQFSIESYWFDQDEKKILIATNSEYIYRRSFTAEFYVYDISSEKLQKITDKEIQEPVFTPDGKSVIYAFQNNLYQFDLANQTEIEITTDGQKNHIINGITDWVYEEEFGFVRAFEISKNGNYLAYIRFDQTQVPEFSMDIYGSGLYPAQHVFKYPKAGEKNAKISLHIYDFNTKKTKKINFKNSDDFYIPVIKWTNQDNLLSVQTTNRHQNDLDFYFVDAQTGTTKIILNEKSPNYVEIFNESPVFLDDNSFIWMSEKDGFNHLYHYDKTGKLIRKISNGSYWEVTQFYGYDPKTKSLFYQSTENGSTNRSVYKIDLNGKNKMLLSNRTGTNIAIFSADYQYFINSFSSTSEPPKYTLNQIKSSRPIKTIIDNSDLKNRLKNFDLPTKKFIEIAIGKEKLNAWIITPKEVDTLKKHPLLIHQYSGPGSQQVRNSWNVSDDYFHYLLAQEGYVVVTVDVRGTGYKGASFKKCTYKELGKYETEDLIEVARVLGNYSYVDASRIGIWGWSYGGFMSSNCILKGNDVFSLAIAVAPVTSWRLYDTIYTERFMQTPQENPSGYDQNSPLFFADQLKGSYMIVHGTADDNVHVQNTMLMVEALIQNNKQFDWAIYPDKNHGIYGGATRLQLYTKIKNFILDRL